MCQDPKFGPRSHHGVHCCGPQFMHSFPEFEQKMKHLWKHFCHGFGVNVLYNTEDLGDTYLITVLLPGRAKEDVKVSLISNYLNVAAPKPKSIEGTEKKEDKEEECCSFMRKTFSFIDVNMDIPLPHDADSDSIKSVMSNGVLKIKIGKKPPKDININDDNN